MKKFIAGFCRRIAAQVRAQSINLIVWSVIVLVVVAMVAANRSTKAAINAKLTSRNPSVQSAEVLSLAQSRDLANALTDTEDPDSPATSPQNVRSNTIREAAAAELNQLISAGKLSPSVAMDNLFLLDKDTDTTVSGDATTGLAIVGRQSDANLRTLVGKLSDGDPDVRTAAANALGQIGGSRTAQLVAPLLANSAASDAAQTALAAIGKPAVPYLTPMLNGASVDLRTMIVNTLGSIGDLSAVPALLGQVNAQPASPTVHRLAIIALANVVLHSIPEPASTIVKSAEVPPASTPPPTAAQLAQARAALPTFIAAVTTPTEDSFARARSALALGRLGGPEAIAALVGALGDFDSRVANASLTGIQQVGNAAIPALTSASRSSDMIVRVAAASALGGIGDAQALAAIHTSLVDPNPDVRAAAATALGLSANPDAIPALVALLSDPSGEVASSASNSLHLIGTPSIGPLVAALGSTNQAAAFYAGDALRQIGDPSAPALTAALHSPSQSEQLWAAVTLGQLHAIGARPALTALASSGAPRVRWAASQALLQLS